jgi:hypothetical protein
MQKCDGTAMEIMRFHRFPSEYRIYPRPAKTGIRKSSYLSGPLPALPFFENFEEILLKTFFLGGEHKLRHILGIETIKIDQAGQHRKWRHAQPPFDIRYKLRAIITENPGNLPLGKARLLPALCQIGSQVFSPFF